ncbi:PorT family protein [bacterium SCSIO 12741]|nr:PorT family protein [bacterium SCSIO 12741]
MHLYIWAKDSGLTSRLYILTGITLFLLLSATQVQAQRHRYKLKKITNLSTFDDKLVHFGFSLGVNTAGFRQENDLSRNDSLKIVETNPQLGFNLGIVGALHFGKHVSLRFIPTLSFCQRNMEYTYTSFAGSQNKKYIKPVESTYLDFPLNLKLRSARYHNFAAYVVGGFMYSYDLVSQHDVVNESVNPDDIVIKLNQHTYSYQIGAGFDFFLPYFKFSPEFKLSMGLNNNLIQDNTLFATPLNYLKSRIFLVSFTFEG